MKARTMLPAQRINQVVENFPRNSSLVWMHKTPAVEIIGPYDHKRNASGKEQILEEYHYSYTALISLLYSFSNYQDVVEERRSSHDPTVYLKRQLSWIGKSYDVTNWFGYQASFQALESYLYSYSGRWLNKAQQIEFILGFLPILSQFPVPIQAVHNVCSAYNKNHEKIPKKNKLNSIFQLLGLPFEIQAKQFSASGRQTYWSIVTRNSA